MLVYLRVTSLPWHWTPSEGPSPWPRCIDLSVSLGVQGRPGRKERLVTGNPVRRPLEDAKCYRKHKKHMYLRIKLHDKDKDIVFFAKPWNKKMYWMLSPWFNVDFPLNPSSELGTVNKFSEMWFHDPSTWDVPHQHHEENMSYWGGHLMSSSLKKDFVGILYRSTWGTNGPSSRLLDVSSFGDP